MEREQLKKERREGAEIWREGGDGEEDGVGRLLC